MQKGKNLRKGQYKQSGVNKQNTDNEQNKLKGWGIQKRLNGWRGQNKQNGLNGRTTRYGWRVQNGLNTRNGRNKVQNALTLFCQKGKTFIIHHQYLHIIYIITSNSCAPANFGTLTCISEAN